MGSTIDKKRKEYINIIKSKCRHGLKYGVAESDMRSKNKPTTKGSIQLLVDVRGYETCDYYWFSRDGIKIL